ncbi:hypothetical protein V1505DRAFT_52481 [Lipomyces doorenjongii]
MVLSMIVGLVLYPVGLFCFTFTTMSHCIGLFPSYKPYSASALAANTFCRCVFGSILPLFAVQSMYRLCLPFYLLEVKSLCMIGCHV